MKESKLLVDKEIVIIIDFIDEVPERSKIKERSRSAQKWKEEKSWTISLRNKALYEEVERASEENMEEEEEEEEEEEDEK
ncbi:hypothetical protein M0804_000406 [Polistes exclamans]|nr:hypothetical protein M0804_000406 [Polistes exclamans]